MKTKTFKVEIDGVEKEYLVRSPTLENQREAQKVYNQAFTDAIKSKSVVRAKLDDLLEDQGLWNDEKQAKFTELQRELLEGEKRLAKGGFSLNEAKDLAIKMKSVRDEIRDLISVRTSLDNHSAEGQADNSRFNYLVSVCLVYNDTKQPVYKNMEEYLNSSTEKVAILGAQNLANMLYGLDNDYESNLPENKFLKKFKFVDDKLRLVDKKGRLIDKEGRLIDESGRFIDEEGNFVDKFGNKVDKDGEYVVDSQPFLDDDGNPIVLDEEKSKDEKVEISVSTENSVVEQTHPVSASTEQTVSTS
jgi:hypothetical protein